MTMGWIMFSQVFVGSGGGGWVSLVPCPRRVWGGVWRGVGGGDGYVQWGGIV